ncbi:sulfurtransferase TusA [Moraxella caviae]|uniref:Sulfurtransferase TusA n=1 Tax=Moraxella caviae TaxID=34060 RepID=A0A1S9ZWB1_9GAMM|nr:sulfurtransferase TusA [Moraxella caviae]OOR87784.1 sulfurtransferase TusA [Moraxella caviae]STZ10538.1 Sulfurtransferase TusA [Moraxella caviae]VEW11339.1 Sulfurtransferase TusA [Moraxella caviae]
MSQNTEQADKQTYEQTPNHTLDTKGLICPEPVMLLHKTIRKAAGGECIEVLATDPATTRDIPNFCRHLGHTLSLEQTLEDGSYRYLIIKKN